MRCLKARWKAASDWYPTVSATAPVLAGGGPSLRALGEPWSLAGLLHDESDRLYERYAIPGPGRPLFELTAKDKTPSTVDLDDTRRGPLLILGGGRDHTVPAVVARQAAALYRPGHRTEYRELPGRGHSLVFDHGWTEVADLTLSYLKGLS